VAHRRGNTAIYYAKFYRFSKLLFVILLLFFIQDKQFISMSSAKKINIVDERRVFQKEWTGMFFFIEETVLFKVQRPL